MKLRNMHKYILCIKVGIIPNHVRIIFLIKLIHKFIKQHSLNHMLQMELFMCCKVSFAMLWRCKLMNLMLRPKSFSTSKSKLPIQILLEMVMKVILTRLQPCWEMALELVVGKKLNGVSIVFIMFFVSWILVHFITFLLFKKKNLPPCEPFLPLSSSNIVSYLELASNTLQLVLMENHKARSIKIFFTNLKKSHVSKIAINNSQKIDYKGITQFSAQNIYIYFKILLRLNVIKSFFFNGFGF